MADPKEIQRLLNELDKAYRRLGEQNPFSRQETDVRKLEAALRGIQARLEAANESFDSISSSIKASLGELRKTNEALNFTAKSFRGISSVVDQLKYDQQGIKELSEKELNTLQEKLKQRLSDLKTSKSLLEIKGKELKGEKAALEEKLKWVKEKLKSDRLSVEVKNKLLDKERQLNRELHKTTDNLNKTRGAYGETLGILDQEESIQQAISDRISFRIRQEEDLTELMGLSGTALEGIDRALNKIGFSRLSSALGIKEAQMGMKELSRSIIEDREKEAQLTDEIEKARGNLSDAQIKAGFGGRALKNLLEQRDTLRESNAQYGGMGGKIAVLKKGIASMGASLIQNFKDPLVIASLILDSMIKGSDDIANIQKAIGINYGAALNLRLELGLAAANSEKLYVTSKDLQKAFTTLTQQTGFVADFSGDTLITFTTLNKQLGLSEDQAGNLALLARTQGEDTEEILSNTVATVSAMNKQEGVAVDVKKVLNEVSSASKSIAGSLGFAPESLARAAREAIKLGLSLSDVDKIAESLLNFESSIEAELEAELLTGQQLNLERARYFALTNDLEGLSKEIANNEEITAAFSSQNRIQQEALAKSLGISRDQLAQMALSQKFASMSAEEFKEAYGETTYEALVTQSASEKFQASIAKVQDILGNIGVILAPIIDGFAAVVGYLAKSKIFAAGLATILAGLAAKSIITAITTIYASLAQIPFGAGLIGASFVVGGLLSTLGAATAMFGDDIISPAQGGSGYGKRTLFGPEGAIALNDNDTVVAGTNLGGGGGSSPSINIAPLVERMDRMNEVLNQILAKEGTVELDGTKVGTALTVGSYKLQ